MKQNNPMGDISPSEDGKTSQIQTPETEFQIIHIFIRGNYRQDIFFDEVDRINAWNRLWLSAKATKTEIIAAQLLSNHFHLCIRVRGSKNDESHCTKPGGPAVSNFIHFLRMSLSLYFNRRHNVHGSLGSRRYGSAAVRTIDEDGGEDLRDLIRYIIRNVTHHKVTQNYKKWRYSTFGYVFDITDTNKTFTGSNIPDNLRKAYFPATCTIPEDWSILPNGMIIPPQSVFPRDYIEKIFFSKTFYLKACDTPTRRESAMEGEKNERLLEYRQAYKTSDQQIIDFIGSHSLIPIVSMNSDQIKEAVKTIKKELPKVHLRQLSRIFHIPVSTIAFWLSR